MKAYGIPLDGLELGNHPRVLIVEEEPDLGQLICKALVETGRFEARLAGSAFEAGAVTHEFNPQLLVVDVDMPGMSARLISRYLAIDLDAQDTLLIGMSASMTDSDRQVLLQEGFADTLAKPFSIRQLVLVLDNVLAVSV